MWRWMASALLVHWLEKSKKASMAAASIRMRNAVGEMMMTMAMVMGAVWSHQAHVVPRMPLFSSWA